MRFIFCQNRSHFSRKDLPILVLFSTNKDEPQGLHLHSTQLGCITIRKCPSRQGPSPTRPPAARRPCGGHPPFSVASPTMILPPRLLVFSTDSAVLSPCSCLPRPWPSRKPYFCMILWATVPLGGRNREGPWRQGHRL